MVYVWYTQTVREFFGHSPLSGEASFGDASGEAGWTMNFSLSVLLMLFLGQEKCHSAKTTAQNNPATKRSHELVFLFDGKHCGLYPKEMKGNLSECEINVEEYKYWVECVLLAVVSSVGILGNFASCLKFARQRTQKLFHYLLLGLAAFDMVRKSPKSQNP